MEDNLSLIFKDWNEIPKPTSIDLQVCDFVDKINNALFFSLKIRKNNNKEKIILWNNEIFTLRCQVKKDYYQWKNEKSNPVKDGLWYKLKQSNKNLRYALRRESRKRLQQVIYNIESIKNKDPATYWKNLFKLDKFNFVGNNRLPSSVKNSAGKLVSGDDYVAVWYQSFSVLGLNNSHQF
jgi:hypothetical protein